MKIDFDKINKTTGLGLMNKAAVLHFMKAKIEYLESHNKNYTKVQYYAILELKNIIDNIGE